jgi:hypothetical protein
MNAVRRCVGEAKRGAAGPVAGRRRSQEAASLARFLREILRREADFFVNPHFSSAC